MALDSVTPKQRLAMAVQAYFCAHEKRGGCHVGRVFSQLIGGLLVYCNQQVNRPTKSPGRIMRAFHFIDANYGISNLSLKRLKISRFNQLNDPFELLAADLLDPRDRKALSDFKSALDATKGMICFSRSWSNPLLWGHYAEKHSGMALGFDIPDEYLSPVQYTKQRSKVEFDKTTREIVDGPRLVDKLLRTKFVDWEYEDEQRMFVDLDPNSQEGGNHFVEFSKDLVLREVILGLKCYLPVSRVRQLLKDELTPIKVLKAGMALRAFKIIEDRSARI